MTKISPKRLLWLAPLCIVVLPGCTRQGKFNPVDMWNRSRVKPYEQTLFFDDGVSSRPRVHGTVARGQLRTDEAMYTGTLNGRYVTMLPEAMKKTASTKEILSRGQERYNIYCAPCHGFTGKADGMIISRGFPEPPHYGLKRLKDAPIGHYYDVITNGFGAMYSYADRVPTRDRWAISAYVKDVLQPKLETRTKDIRTRADGTSQEVGASGIASSSPSEAHKHNAPMEQVLAPGALPNRQGALPNRTPGQPAAASGDVSTFGT